MFASIHQIQNALEQIMNDISTKMQVEQPLLLHDKLWRSTKFTKSYTWIFDKDPAILHC